MTNGHLYLCRFVAPARMINHRRTPPVSSSVASAVRTQDWPPLAPGVVRFLNTGTHSRMAQSPEIGRFADSRLANCVGGCYR